MKTEESIFVEPESIIVEELESVGLESVLVDVESILVELESILVVLLNSLMTPNKNAKLVLDTLVEANLEVVKFFADCSNNSFKVFILFTNRFYWIYTHNNLLNY